MEPVIFEHLVRLLFDSEDYRDYLALRCTNDFWFRFDTEQLCKEAFLVKWGPLTSALSFEDFDWERELVRRRFLMHCDDVWELPNNLVVPPAPESELSDDGHATLRFRAHAMRIHECSLFNWTTYNGSVLAASFSLANSLASQLPETRDVVPPEDASSHHWLFNNYFRDPNFKCGDDWGNLNDYLELMKHLDNSPAWVTLDVLKIEILNAEEVIRLICMNRTNDEDYDSILNTALFLMRCPYLPANTLSCARELASVKARLSTMDALKREMSCGRYEWASYAEVRGDLDGPWFFTDCGYSDTAALLMCVARGGDSWLNRENANDEGIDGALASEAGPVLPIHSKTYFTMLAAHDAS